MSWTPPEAQASWQPPEATSKAPVGLAEENERKRYEEYVSSVRERNTRVSIPGAESYDKTPPLSLEAWREQRKQEIVDKYKGAGEAVLSFATGIPATMVAGAAGLTAPINPLTKRKPHEFFEDVQSLLTYVPRTEAGQKMTQAIGDPLQAFPPVGVYVNAPAMRAGRRKPQTFDERLNEVTQEPPKPVEASSVEIKAPDWRLEAPIAADIRVREQNMKMPSAEDYNNRDANAKLVQEEIDAFNAAEAFNKQQEQLEALQKSVDDLAKLNELNPDGTYKTQTLIDDTPFGDRPAQFGFTDTGGRVDENGIPIRADLSMDAQNVQNPLQRNLWGDELPGRTGDGGLPLTRALDKMEPGPMRDTAIEQLSGNPTRPLESQVQDILNRGMGGKQRGAINMEMFQDGFERIKNLPNGLRLVLRGSDDGYVEVKAYSPQGALAGDAVFVIDDFVNPNPDKSHLLSSSTGVYPNQRRQGIASELYKFAAEQGNDIIPSNVQTAQGKAMWEGFERKGLSQGGMIRGQRGAIDLQALGFRTGSEADKLVKDLMGKKLRAAIPKGEDVIGEAMEAGKDSRQSIMFSAGATLQAMKTRSPLIQGAARIIQGHKNIAEDAVRQFVFPVEDKFRKVAGKGIEELASLLKREQFGRQILTPEQLNKLGLTEEQLLAYQSLRNMHEEAFKVQNETRLASGKPAITELEYYMSSRWQGDFRIPIFDEKGRLVWYIAADNKWAANNHAKSVMDKFPGLTKGGMSVVKSSRKGPEMGGLYAQMLDVAGRDNPMVKEIKKWMEGEEAALTEQTLGQLKHFEPKGNVRGFVGDRPYKNPRKEAYDYIQSQISYAKNAFQWAELQKAGQEIKKILADENINATQPRNVQYIREYWLDQLGMNEHKFFKALEDTLRSAGVSPNQVGRGISNVKNFWVVQKLAANLGFLASNVIQYGMTLPQLMDIQVKNGGNAISSLISGTITGMLMGAGHTSRKSPQFYKAVAMAGGERFVLDAMKYAEDNSVIARSIYDESPIANQFSPYAKMMNFAGKTITLPETYLRGSVYMSYVHMLKSSGKYTDDLSLFREAEERTNASMGDYREGERALIFSKMGQLGNAANTLQTFPMNYYNQWSWAMREAGTGNVLPAITMFAVQGYLAGAFGLPLFQEIDKGWELMKDWLAKIDPRAWEKVKGFSLKELVLNTGGADMLYGSLSEDTGIAMTSRAAAPVPSEMAQVPFAPVTDIAGMAVDAGKLAFDPMDKQKQAQAALSFAPAGATGYLETGPLKGETASTTRPDGSTVYKKTSDLAGRDAVVVRTPEDEAIRKFGVRSQREQVSKDLQYVAGKRASQTRNVLRDLPDRIYNAARKGEKEDITEFVQLYARLGGDPRTLTTGAQRAMMDEYFTPTERMAMSKKPTVEAVKQYKLLMDTLKELGYAE